MSAVHAAVKSVLESINMRINALSSQIGDALAEAERGRVALDRLRAERDEMEKFLGIENDKAA